MPSKSKLPSRNVFIENLIDAAPSSTGISCPICKEEYSESHLPTRLPPCGHIFGKSCLLAWFKEGAKTCPLDRQKLFAPPKNGEEIVPRPRTPVGEVRSRRNAVPASSSEDERLHPRCPSVAFVLYSSGEIIAINGYITLNGCRNLVQDLWYHTGFLFDQVQSPYDLAGPPSAAEDDIHRCIVDALPRGLHIQRVAWPLLKYIARMMLTCYAMARAEGTEVTMSTEDAVSWETEIWTICRPGNIGE